MPQDPDFDELGGWGLESDAESDSSENDDMHNASDEESPADVASPPQVSSDTVSVTISQSHLDPVVQAVAAETPNLRSLLHQILNAGGLPPRQSPSSQHLFKNISISLCDQTAIKDWLMSKQNDWLFLQAPHGLQNPFFFTCVAARVRSTRAHLQLATVALGYDNEIVQNYGEYLLASLCYQLLPPDAHTDLEGHLLDITNDLGAALKGYNYDWRETMLWSLLQSILINGANIPWILAISFPPDLDSAASQVCVNILTRLSDFTKATERSMKILISLGSHNPTTFGMPDVATVTVDLDDEGTKGGLLADLESWWDETA